MDETKIGEHCGPDGGVATKNSAWTPREITLSQLIEFLAEILRKIVVNVEGKKLTEISVM